MINTAPDASFSKAIEELHKFSVDDLVAEIKAKLLDRSANGIRGIFEFTHALGLFYRWLQLHCAHVGSRRSMRRTPLPANTSVVDTSMAHRRPETKCYM